MARPKVRIRCHGAFIQECHELAVSFDEQSCCVPALDWRTTLPPLSLRRMGTNKFARYCTPKLIFLHAESVSLFGRSYRIMNYLLLAGLVWEKNTIVDWKFTIAYEQTNRLLISFFDKPIKFFLECYLNASIHTRAPLPAHANSDWYARAHALTINSKIWVDTKRVLIHLKKRVPISRRPQQ